MTILQRTATLAAAAALALAPMAAFADTIDLGNNNTGNNSTNINRVRIRVSNSKKIIRKAHVHDSFNVHVNTGGNEQNKNTNAGDQTSGDVTLTFTVTNTVN